MSIKQFRQRLTLAEESYRKANPGRDLTTAREELNDARAEYSVACIALVERLSDTLKPFAEEADCWHPNTPIDDTVVTVRDRDDWVPINHKLCIGDLRAIAAIYDEVRHGDC